MQTIDQFIEKHGVAMTATRIPARTDSAAANFDSDAFHYLITLSVGKRSFSLNYSMGCGHVEKVPFEKVRFYLGDFTRKDYDNLPRPGARRITLHQEQAMRLVWKPKPPELADVLDCLASDCSGYDNARSFEDWASEYGYDTDSRKAEATYRTIGEQFRQMEALLGRQALRELMYETERR